MNNFIKNQLLVISACVLIISSLMLFDFVIAGPTEDPVSGNPAITPAPDGPQGYTGGTGNTGGRGPTGYTGSTGATGARGIAYCNYPGYGSWISHGWDGGCAFWTGMHVSCLTPWNTGLHMTWYQVCPPAR